MDMLKELKVPFGEICNGRWKKVIDFYKERPDYMMFPLNKNRDTIFHLAIHSKKKSPFVELRNAMNSYMSEESHKLFFSMNDNGNTIFHEAAAVGNLEVIKLLIHNYKELVKTENRKGETPVFVAAAFGNLEIVQFFIKDNTNIESHRTRRVDGQSILRAAIEGEYFETAFFLLELDQSLGIMEEQDGRTALHFLANMPSAFRSGYSTMDFVESFIYKCIPSEVNQVPSTQRNDDLETGMRVIPIHESSSILEVLKGNGWISQLVPAGPQMVERVVKEKRRHEFAVKLAKSLVRLTIWEDPHLREPETTPEVSLPPLEAPLFLATRIGILEIVRQAIKEHPQAIEDLNHMQQNILHLAVLHRHKPIFCFFRLMEVQWERMNQNIDKNGHSLLHQVADTRFYTGGTRPGPALKLQDEIQWFDSVKRVLPSHYAMHRENTYKMTPWELFKKNHTAQLTEAQKWIKETSQSCSTVAVLVATVVFAAAYAVPGGTNKKGIPVLIKSPIFVFFTIMDVISLAFSLTSVVAFLSMLTSPLEFNDFRQSIPRKLTFGFTMLFFSVITTVLAFGSTILLVARSEEKWTASFISVAAFLSISAYVVLQSRMYWEMIKDIFGNQLWCFQAED